MPTGPSHSSGGFGGGGGHSSGGGFGGGGFSFGGGSNGWRRRPTGPRTIHFFGRSIIIAGGQYSSAVGFFAFVIFFAIFSAFLGLFAYSNNSDIKSYSASAAVFEEDAEFFSDLITKAKAGKEDEGYYLTTANFDGINLTYVDGDTRTGIFYYDMYNNIPYYFIQYEYVNTHAEDSINLGTTYAQFSSSAANGLIISGEGQIEIAYTKFEGEWWSINTNYSLEKNIEYKMTLNAIDETKSSQKFVIGFMIVTIVATIGFLAAAILKLVSGAKKAKAEALLEAEKKEAEISEAQARAEEARASAESKQAYVCSYCGSDIPAGETKCPMCGSSKRTKKKDLNKDV